MVDARDGAKVPVSIVYKTGFEKNGEGKLFLYAYGAYGMAIPPAFNSNRISLLDRGWACAIAHIRGGDDLGYKWFLDGKLDQADQHVQRFRRRREGPDRGEASRRPDRIAINGGSAGGELMGAVVNSDPELWGAVVADVPFVDVLNTMLDDTLPLTPGEWPEWGNPIIDKAAFDYIRSYSPYDNVKRAGLSADADHRRAHRPARDLLGAGQMGGEAARDQDRPQPAAAQDQHGRRPRRQVGPVGEAARGRGDLRVHPDRDGQGEPPGLRDGADRAARSTSTSSATSTMRCGCSGSSRSPWRTGTSVADPSIKDAYYLGRGAARDRLSARRARRRSDHGPHLGRRRAAGRAVRPAAWSSSAPDGKVCVRAQTQWAIIDKALGPADPRAGTKSWRPSFRKSKRPGMSRPILYDY